ncbi:hypothetical protein DFH06DRAFT_1383973 [Mycena polygramma]|nr:hypothetical protein DFH06DRAFT_1383973 [Mycena polygramma]
MSKSRSVTPTPNFYAINLPSSSSGPTTSRTPTDDTSTTTITTAPPTTSGESQQPSPTQFTHFHSFVSTQTSPDDLIHRRPSPESPPMAKRMRRQSLEEDTSRSQSSDSQSGMADNEGTTSPYSGTSPPPVAPLKKKRTRTLTTPHQSAVLHALLAQSRFPTTAMREEVGRSIGLSARKVQNQRQKARRPGSQGETSQQGPPHYTSFPNAPSSYPGPSEHLMSHGEREGRAIPHAYSGYPPSEPFLGSAEAPPQLLGPGMPGRSSQRGRPVLHLASSDAPSDYGRHDLPPPPFSSRSLPGPRTLESENFGTLPFHRTHGNDPSRTLPPLIFNRPSSSQRQDLPSSSFMFAHSAPTTPSHPSPYMTSPSPSPTFAHDITEHQSYSTTALGLPPPFTLQPQPQWDSASSSQRPHSAAWSRSGSGSHSTRGSSSPPSSFVREPSPSDNGNGDTPRLGSAQPSRSGRYDPVRAVFVPTSDSPPAGPSSSSSSSAPSA